MRRIAPQLFAVLKCLVKFSSTEFGSVPMSLLVSVIRGRFVYSAIHSERSVSSIMTREVENRLDEDKALTSGVCLSYAWPAMQEKRHPSSFSLDEVCSPCWSLNRSSILVDSYEALGKSLQGDNSVFICDQAVDHPLLELWLLEISDVEPV